MDEREHEIVARAIAQIHVEQEDGFGPLTEEDCAKLAQAAISALDSHRAKNAGEVEQALDKLANHLLSLDSGSGEGKLLVQAANLISTLRSAIAEKDEALRLLEVGAYPIKGSQPIHDPTQLHAWDLGCKDTREMVSAIAARARSSLSDRVNRRDDLGNCFECGAPLSIWCRQCNPPQPKE